MRKKQNSLEIATHVSSIQIPISQPESSPEPSVVNEAKVEATVTNNDGANKYENVSDNGSEISDEGYRSLGLIQSNNAKRISILSQASNEDADTNGEQLFIIIYNANEIVLKLGRLDRNSPDMTTTASEETTISEMKADSPISDIVDIVEPIKELETKFTKCGIVMNDDEISVDIAAATGLRKTDYSEVLYEDNPIIAARKAVVTSRIPKSPMLSRRKSMENCSQIEKGEEDSIRKMPTYRSVRNKSQQPSPQHQQHQKLQSKENGTWSGRTSTSPTNQSRKRPVITSDTFKSPSRTASLTRNTPTRSSQQQPRQRSSTRASSVNTSPNKSMNSSQSQLAQQLLDAAGKAKNDTQILDKIKQILNDYASKTKTTNDFEDFTTTWVNNNGNLADTTDSCNTENASNNGLSLKSRSKRSSSVSTSSDSNPTTSSAAAAAVVSPRRIDKGLSRIPAPIRSNTGLY